MIRAAGALPWRRRRGALQVALVHRPRYDDWAWAKGKLESAEEWPVAAVREVFEETGFHVHLGRTLPISEYAIPDQAGAPTTKVCRYWAAEVVGGDGTLVHEIDEVAWLDVADASARLTYPRDHDQLHALVDADQAGTLTTWPLVIVRHAKSRSRMAWPDADPLRPLNTRGHARAAALVPILAAYGVTRVVTSPSVRCLDTVMPYAVSAGQRPRLKEGLSEEGFVEEPERASHHLTQLIERGNAAVVCTHGPVLPKLLERLVEIADSDSPDGTHGPGGTHGPDGTHGPRGGHASVGSGRTHGSGGGHTSVGSGDSSARVALSEAAHHGLGKGEALVAHLVGTGAQARVVDVERHPAP